MIVKDKLKRLYEELAKSEVSHIELAGSVITVRIYDRFSKLTLSAQVYHGNNFIPKSVRDCISNVAPFTSEEIKTYTTLDEGHSEIFLNYIGTMDSMSRQQFVSVLEEFGYLADKWRWYLDDHDKKDLIYVHVKK